MPAAKESAAMASAVPAGPIRRWRWHQWLTLANPVEVAAAVFPAGGSPPRPSFSRNGGGGIGDLLGRSGVAGGSGVSGGRI
uniref:Uncharacterized protein n=1 Tax=Oryza glumipatula TaxID=40148 RepID=A0A0E0ASN8_9ORYZ